MSASLFEKTAQSLKQLQYAAALLAHEGQTSLSERQQARLSEIERAALAIDEWVRKMQVGSMATAGRSRIDPRIGLVYATRTHLAMIEMSCRLLMVAHLRRTDSLSVKQYDLVQTIDDCSQDMTLIIDRIWLDMQHET